MYTDIYNKIIFPFYETVLRRRNTLTYLNQLNKSQWYSEEQLMELQWVKVQSLLKHAYENVPYYKEVFTTNKLHWKDIKSIKELEVLPVLTKDIIRNRKEDLVATNYRKYKLFNDVTGGSTGTPLRFSFDHDNYEWRQAAVKRVYGWTGYRDGDKTVMIWGASVQKEAFFNKIKHNFDEALKRHRIYNTFYFNENRMNNYIEDINRFKPSFIIAYTTPLYNFANYIKTNNKEVFHPKAIIVAAEKLFNNQREVIQNVFNSPVFETYGCREVTSIAGECEHHKGLHINMENVLVEIVSQNRQVLPGEVGEILLTDLNNYAMPFIRYKNEDLGAFSNNKCDCKRNLKMLKNVKGRVLDTIKTLDGNLIPGEFFIYWFMRFSEIKQFQVIQESINRLSIKLVINDKIAEEQLKAIRDIVYKIMGNKISIDINIVTEIELTSSGKYRVVKSNIPIEFERNKLVELDDIK